MAQRDHPGRTAGYVSDYVKFCRAGVEAARAVDPGLRSVLAGGLWPRGFRLEVLNAGAGKYVDTLPIHYGNGAGIEEARQDLDAYGYPRVGVWENESCAFVIQWHCPGLEWVSETVKCNWVLSQWADELAAGCEKLIYFGGEGAATGYGDYLRADFTPLPVAATLAVLAAKTFDAKPVGVFSTADTHALFHLFERDGKPILIASSARRRAKTYRWPWARSPSASPTTKATRPRCWPPAASPVCRLLPCAVSSRGPTWTCSDAPRSCRRGPVGRRQSRSRRRHPQITLLEGKPGAIRIRLRNPYSRPLGGTLRLDLPESWLSQREQSFSLQPGERKIVTLPVTVPRSTALAAFPYQLRVTFDWPKLPAVSKPFVVSVISPQSVGNLLRNGDFEQVEADGKTPKHWRGSQCPTRIQRRTGAGTGQARAPLQRQQTSWANYGQTVALRGGTTYLYTAWVWNQGMEGGSNIDQTMSDGSTRSLYNMDVINIGNSTPSWQVFTCRYKAPENLATAGFVMVARGPGAALYDNLRVTAFEGTDFAAEAVKVRRPPLIDGSSTTGTGRAQFRSSAATSSTPLDKDYDWTRKT